MLLGLLIRVWLARTPGGFYRRTLRVTEKEQIVEKGAYRLVRHPGYLGITLSYVGSGVAADMVGAWRFLTPFLFCARESEEKKGHLYSEWMRPPLELTAFTLV